MQKTYPYMLTVIFCSLQYNFNARHARAIPIQSNFYRRYEYTLQSPVL